MEARKAFSARRCRASARPRSSSVMAEALAGSTVGVAGMAGVTAPSGRPDPVGALTPPGAGSLPGSVTRARPPRMITAAAAPSHARIPTRRLTDLMLEAVRLGAGAHTHRPRVALALPTEPQG